jgi:ubiquinone/menaquinone biosynthesis C-methylase UbiE
MEYSFVLRALGCYQRISNVRKILDIGSGTSAFPAALGSKVKGEIRCVDRQTAIVEAMSKLELPNCTYELADMSSLPYGDRSFDVVSCISVLEHVKRAVGLTAISEMLRVTKDDGLVIVTVDYRSLTVGSTLKKWINRLSKAATYVLHGETGAVVRAATSAKPYTWYDLKQISSVFTRSVAGKPQRSWSRLRSEEIRRFWSTFWRPDLNYDPLLRDYTSVGILLSRDSYVRSALVACEALNP